MGFCGKVWVLNYVDYNLLLYNPFLDKFDRKGCCSVKILKIQCIVSFGLIAFSFNFEISDEA